MERERFFPLPPFFLHISFAPFSLFSNLGKLLRLIESVYSISIFFLFDFSKILFFFFAGRESRLVVKFLETILCLPSRYLSPIRGTGRFGEVRGAPLASAGNVRGISSVLGHCTPRQRDSFPCHESPCPAIKGCTRRAPANNFYFTSKK